MHFKSLHYFIRSMPFEKKKKMYLSLYISNVYIDACILKKSDYTIYCLKNFLNLLWKFNVCYLFEVDFMHIKNNDWSKESVSSNAINDSSLLN